MVTSIKVDQKRPRGRPATGRGDLVSSRFMPPLLAALDAWAKKRGVTRSTAIRLLVEKALGLKPQKRS
jgi:hypothetical protein